MRNDSQRDRMRAQHEASDGDEGMTAETAEVMTPEQIVAQFRAEAAAFAVAVEQLRAEIAAFAVELTELRLDLQRGDQLEDEPPAE